MTQYRVIKPIPVEMVLRDGELWWADTCNKVDFDALEKHGFVEPIEEPDPTVALGEAWDSGWESAAHRYWHKPRNPYTGEMNQDDPDDYCPGHGGTGTVGDCLIGPDDCS